MTTAVVTGFTVHQPLMRRSFAPLISLRRAGVIDRLLYVTWDNPAIDGHVAPALEWPDVELVRVPQPPTRGTAGQRGFVYQSRNLAAALNLINDPDELVLKLRPDFLADETFLAAKIASFERWGRAPDFSRRIPVAMPPSPLKARVWVPWADASAPFFQEDAAFMGLACDLACFTHPIADEMVHYCGDAASVNFAHVLRFIIPFLDDYPVFRRYLRDFNLFRMELNYRRSSVPLSAADPFFWHLAVANAWVLINNFHVDCGDQGQLHLVVSSTAHAGLGKPVEELLDHVVYKDVAAWRKLEEPGTFLPLLSRVGGRLVDDDWQQRLFSGPVEQGYTYENLLAILDNLMRYNTGLLSGLEENYYAALDALYRTFNGDGIVQAQNGGGA